MSKPTIEGATTTFDDGALKLIILALSNFEHYALQ